MWYDWRDDGDNPDEREHRFGIVRHQYRRRRRLTVFDPKPAYFAAQTLTRELNGLYFRRALKRRGRQTIGFWTVWARRQNRFGGLDGRTPTRQNRARPKCESIALPPGKWRVISHLGEHLPDAFQGAGFVVGRAVVFGENRVK